MPIPGTRRRVGLLGCLLTVVSLVAIVIVSIVIVAAVPDPLGLALSLVAATVPALFYASLVLRLDRYEPEPLRAILACFFWGAFGAILFSLIAELMFSQALHRYLADEATWVVEVALGAPLIEETFKGIAVLVLLLIARHEVDNVLDGMVYGALVGVGFAMTENVLYFGQGYIESGFRQFGVLVLARAVLGGLGHPAYTAVTGASLGWARSQYRRGVARFFVPVLGWAIAVALHVAWNGGLFLTIGFLGSDTGLLTAVAVQAALVIVPAVLVLYAIARQAARHELEMLRQELQFEVAQGIFTSAEYETITDAARRRDALTAARSRGGKTLRAKQQEFFTIAAELAFLHHHRREGEPVGAEAATRDEAFRRRIIALRHELDPTYPTGNALR
ncbi:MAG: PrsW family intramembrane metalloprotease [Thermomicrobiales bacterium]